jgi:hypothetical protein
MGLRDYAEGALEALSWIRMMIRGSNERCRTCQRVLEEIEDALDEMQTGVAVDFRRRISVSW